MLSDTVMNYALFTFAVDKAGARNVNNEFSFRIKKWMSLALTALVCASLLMNPWDPELINLSAPQHLWNDILSCRDPLECSVYFSIQKLEMKSRNVQDWLETLLLAWPLQISDIWHLNAYEKWTLSKRDSSSRFHQRERVLSSYSQDGVLKYLVIEIEVIYAFISACAFITCNCVLSAGRRVWVEFSLHFYPELVIYCMLDLMQKE